MDKITNQIISDTGCGLYLPKSKKTILLEEDLPVDKIDLIDKYLANEKNTSGAQQITPNALQCGTHVTKVWVYQDQYKPVTGKYLGIWNNYVNWQKLHNTYGFRMIYVANNNEIDNARASGFQYDSLMLGLANYNTAFSTIEAANSGGRHVGYYHINEPIETGTWYDALIQDVAEYVYPTKVMVCSYKWPVWPQYYSYPVTYGQKYGAIINSLDNIYIMCDEYHGNCFGEVDDYWNEFRTFYSSNKSIMNWVHVVINNGSGNNTCDLSSANSWYDLLGSANDHGVNKFWLYASSTGDENGIKEFCNSAWERGWLLQKMSECIITWKCSTIPCTNCVWPSGAWYIEEEYYDGNYRWMTGY